MIAVLGENYLMLSIVTRTIVPLFASPPPTDIVPVKGSKSLIHIYVSNDVVPLLSQ